MTLPASTSRETAERCALDFPCPSCRARQGQRCRDDDPDISGAIHPARLDLGATKARRQEQRERHRRLGHGGVR